MGGVLVLDDLMEEGGSDKRVLDLFTKDSRHRGITATYLTQDLFPPGKFSKTINRNAHYIVAFENPRDQTGIRTVLLQAFPDLWREILDLFKKITTSIRVFDVGSLCSLERPIPIMTPVAPSLENANVSELRCVSPF